MAHRLLTPPHTTAADRQADGDRALAAYLRLLAGAHPTDRFFEIRAIGRGQVRRSFVLAARPGAAAARVRESADCRDVYLGVALRTTNQFGGKRAINGSHLVWIECDSPSAAATLAHFEHPPTMVIASGTPGHVHVYWQLRHSYRNEQIERANRQLAHHLGGDPASVDIARVLRPPGSTNHKHHPPTPVELVAHRPAARYTLPQLTQRLPDPEPRNAGGTLARVWVGDVLDARLRAIPAADYVRVLADRVPDRAGKISCPFHEDDTPSLQLYPDGTFFCFGCRRGGSIYDFASALWSSERSAGVPLRGRHFVELRQRLIAMFFADPGGT